MKVKILILTLLLQLPLYAQDGNSEPDQPVNIITIDGVNYAEEFPSKMQLNRRVIFLYDRSGSMSSTSLTSATRFIQSIITSNVDDFEIAIIAFDDITSRWPGMPEPDSNPPIPNGWARLPSRIAIERSLTWINGLSSRGNTNVMLALRTAMVEPVDELSIVLVSDGLFGETPQEIITILEASQERRIDRDLQPVSIMAFGAIAEKNDMLMAIGEFGQLGYYRVSN